MQRTNDVFLRKFSEHLHNEFYGIKHDESKTSAIAKAQQLMLLARDNLYSNVNSKDIKAIIVPHAGLDYSGLCAASAYNALLGDGNHIKRIKTVIILSTRHSGRPGILIPDLDYFTYHHHKFNIDNNLYGELVTSKGVHISNDPEFLEEHSLEIQMPFIFNLFNRSDVKILPILVGELTDKQLLRISEILRKYDSEQTTWIINTDLIHANGRFGYDVDVKTLSDTLIRTESQFAIHFLQPCKTTHMSLDNQYNKNKPTICGIHTIKLWSAIAQNMDLIGKVTSYYSNLHVTELPLIVKKGHRTTLNLDAMFHRFTDTKKNDSSVSYLGAIYVPREKVLEYPLKCFLTTYEKLALLDFVKRIAINIANNIDLTEKKSSQLIRIAWKTPPPFISGSYLLKSGVFITFKNNKILRGCIGTTGNDNDLLSNIVKYTIEAGFNDSRQGLTKTHPLTVEEINNGFSSLLYNHKMGNNKLEIDINILKLPEKLNTDKDNNVNEKLIEKWNIGQDGIMIVDIYSNRSALFLPSVPTEYKWTRQETMDALAKKAGIENWKKNNINIFIIPGYEFSNRKIN